MSPRPMSWAGYWADSIQYFQGDVVIISGQVFIASRLIENFSMPTMHNQYGWVYIGAHEPHKVDHHWMPELASYPLPSGALLSEPTPLCRECWYTNNYVMAFKADAHHYVIQEMP